MFPKKIHQTWVDFNNRESLSDNEDRWINTWKQKNESWKSDSKGDSFLPE